MRVSISSPLIRLFGAHVARRADELAKAGEQRLLGELADCVALAMPKSMTFGTGRPSCVRDQHVGRLEVAMNDAFLMGVLDGLADC